MPGILLHAPTPEGLARARSNARNALAAAPDTRIEIVANAGGVAAALADPDAATDPLLRLCRNSLRGQGLDPGDLATVPVAVLHIARRQSEGWAYIRA